MIPYEDLKKVNQRLIPDYISLLTEELQKGWYILGSQVQAFETNYANYHHVPYCVGVANGLDALILGLKVFDFPEGSEVIVPSNTYIATILSIVQCGLTPVLVEPSIDDYLIDVTQIESKITSTTVAIMPVHLYGKVCDMESILRIAKKYNLIQAEGNVIKWTQIIDELWENIISYKITTTCSECLKSECKPVRISAHSGFGHSRFLGHTQNVLISGCLRS